MTFIYGCRLGASRGQNAGGFKSTADSSKERGHRKYMLLLLTNLYYWWYNAVGAPESDERVVCVRLKLGLSLAQCELS